MVFNRTERPNILQLLRLTALIFVFGIPACAPMPSTTNKAPVLTLNFHASTMEGPGPEYSFKIYEDGLVLYHGRVQVKVIGDRLVRITPSQVQELVVTFKKIYNLFDRYEFFGKNKNFMSRTSTLLSGLMNRVTL